MSKPNFLIIGSPKCGTTSLYNYLGQHPKIEFSDVKEPKYFSFKNLNLNFNANEVVVNQIKKSTIQNKEGYLNLFKNKTAPYIGEASPNYFHFEPAAKNIYDFDPQMKLIVILRNPVDRLYSDWKHNVRMGYDRQYNFRKAINLIEKRKRSNKPPYFDYLEKGNYGKHLKRYYGLFNKNQIKIVFYDDLKKDANKVCNDIIRFLGVSDEFNFDTSKIYMKSYPIYKSNLLRQIGHLVKKISFNLYNYVNKINTVNETIYKNDRDYFLKFYKKDILVLESLINIDLKNWLKN